MKRRYNFLLLILLVPFVAIVGLYFYSMAKWNYHFNQDAKYYFDDTQLLQEFHKIDTTKYDKTILIEKDIQIAYLKQFVSVSISNRDTIVKGYFSYGNHLRAANRFDQIIQGSGAIQYKFENYTFVAESSIDPGFFKKPSTIRALLNLRQLNIVPISLTDGTVAIVEIRQANQVRKYYYQQPDIGLSPFDFTVRRLINKIEEEKYESVITKLIL